MPSALERAEEVPLLAAGVDSSSVAELDPGPKRCSHCLASDIQLEASSLRAWAVRGAVGVPLTLQEPSAPSSLDLGACS